MAKIEKITAGITGAQASQLILDNDKAAVSAPYVAGTHTGPLTRSYNDELYYLPDTVETAQAPPNPPWEKITKAGSPLDVEGGAASYESVKNLSDMSYTDKESGGLEALTINQRMNWNGTSQGPVPNWYTTVRMPVTKGDQVHIETYGGEERPTLIWYATEDVETGTTIKYMDPSETTIFTWLVDQTGYVLVSSRDVVWDPITETNNPAPFEFRIFKYPQFLTPSDLDSNREGRGVVSVKSTRVKSSFRFLTPLQWAEFGRIEPSGAIGPNGGWRGSGFRSVQKGTLLKYHLRGEAPYIAIGLYGEAFAGTFKQALVTYEGAGEINMISGEVEVPEDGYIYAGINVAAAAFGGQTPSMFVVGFDPVNGVKISTTEIMQAIGRDSREIATEELLQISRPNYAELHFDGEAPISFGQYLYNRMAFKVNGATLFNAIAGLEVQGHGSAAYPKKGFTLDLYNVDMDALAVKFGDQIPIDSFHLKAYATDRTQSRDVSLGRIWRDMVSTLDYPASKVNNKPYEAPLGARVQELYISDAAYHTVGFPVAVYMNGAFQGLHTLRSKKTRENYALNNRNANHIFLDSSTYFAFLRQPFNPVNWDVKSPRMTGYEEAGPIPDAAVVEKIQRLWSFTTDLANKYAQHADYIVLDHWVIWVIFGELFSNRDTDGNNYNIMTWDGVHWSILPYDLDLTMGLDPWANTTQGQFTVRTVENNMVLNYDIWTTFKSVYATQIRAMYTSMRRSGFIQTARLYKYFIDQVNEIPAAIYDADRAKWASLWSTEPTMEQIALFIDNKIKYLDTQWLNP